MIRELVSENIEKTQANSKAQYDKTAAELILMYFQMYGFTIHGHQKVCPQSSFIIGLVRILVVSTLQTSQIKLQPERRTNYTVCILVISRSLPYSPMVKRADSRVRYNLIGLYGVRGECSECLKEG